MDGSSDSESDDDLAESDFSDEDDDVDDQQARSSSSAVGSSQREQGSSPSDEDTEESSRYSRRKSRKERRDRKTEAQPSTISEMGLGAVLQRCPARIEWQGRDAFFLDVTPLTPQQAQQEREAAAANSSGSGPCITVVVNGEDSENEEDEENQTRSTSAVTEIPVTTSSASEDEQQPTTDQNPDQDPTQEPNQEESRNPLRPKPNLPTDILTEPLTKSITDSMSALEEAADAVVRLGLEGRTNYRRLSNNLGAKTDPLSGVYVGAFGAHGPELVQLVRSTIEGEEWVVATKITGDVNVPAGEVSFKAKIGKANRVSTAGVYPPEFGVMHRYLGEGRVAQEGFRNPKMVSGDLLTLTASNPLLPGATLGFVFNMDDGRKFLVLFSKLDLDSLPMQ